MSAAIPGVFHYIAVRGPAAVVGWVERSGAHRSLQWHGGPHSVRPTLRRSCSGFMHGVLVGSAVLEIKLIAKNPVRIVVPLPCEELRRLGIRAAKLLGAGVKSIRQI